MAEAYTPDAISVLISDNPDDKLTLAEFQWSGEPPRSTYTIDANHCVSIELSSFFPVRPAVVRWEHRGQIGEVGTIEELFGTSFAETMTLVHEAHSFNAVVLRGLSLHSRVRIAELQLASPSTPTKLKHLCASMLGELRLREDAEPAA